MTSATYIEYSTGWAEENPLLAGQMLNEFVASVPEGAQVSIDTSRRGFVTLSWRLV